MKTYVYGDLSSRGHVCRRLSLTVGFLALLVFQSAIVQAEDQQSKTKVTGVTAQKLGKSALEVRIQGDSNLAYTSYDLPDPERVVVDIANASLQQGLLPRMPSDSNISLQTREIGDANPQILRFEFATGDSLPYTARQEGNDVLVSFDLQKVASSPTRRAKRGRAGKSSGKQTASAPEASRSTAPSGGGEDFGFSGYERERISVDFYKMDLHNVFRFLREVSGTNIIVDESVQGTLTLTLDNVPWDFALDVILNLKDLKSIERYNTIVVYPKNKDFVWPGKTKSNLSFKPEGSTSQQESLVITQAGQQQPIGFVEASQLIAKGREFERAHNPAMAAQTYEQAFEKWRSNGKLANRISTIYLVELRQNAKALQYAKRALAINKRDSVAALNAAIASANMRDMPSAATYFDMSVQGSRPSQEALISYALFREEARQYDQALQILGKHDTLYGRSLEAMVARARILDKRGASAQAVQAYRAILSSGFTLPSDLSRFVRARVGMAN